MSISGQKSFFSIAPGVIHGIVFTQKTIKSFQTLFTRYMTYAFTMQTIE